jgi:outer membrane protein TolC
MKKKTTLLSLICLPFALLINLNEVIAQTETLKVSLAEAQKMAIEKNYSHLNAQLDLEIAKKKVWETTATGLPQVNAGVDLSIILNELPTLSIPGPPGPDGQPTEMNIEVGEKANATFSVTASQLVFSGPYIVGLQASKAYKNLSENALDKSEEDIKYNVASAYYTALLLEETKGILDSSVNNLQKLYSDSEAMLKTGFIDQTAKDQIKVSLSLLESSNNETGRQVQSAINLLKFHLGIDINSEILLSDELDTFTNSLSPTLNQTSSINTDNNIDLRIMANQVELSKLQLKLEKSNFLPTISAFATYQRLAKQPVVNFTPEALAGASLSLPIFSSGMRRSKVQQAKLELLKSTNSFSQVQQSLELEFANAKAQYLTAWDKYQSQKDNKDLASRVYKNYQVQYSKGVASQRDVIEANDKFLQAVGNYIGATVELLNAKLMLDKITGNL